jgi:hypothetical protein
MATFSVNIGRIIGVDLAELPEFKHGSKGNPLFDKSISLSDLTPEMIYRGLKMLEKPDSTNRTLLDAKFLLPAKETPIMPSKEIVKRSLGGFKKTRKRKGNK